MNPFDLTGPPFLLFFICLSLTTIIAMRLFNRSCERAQDHAPVMLEDPYAIAFLRGGNAEAARVATIALIDRGLLKASADKLVIRSKNAEEFVKRPIEQAVLTVFRRSTTGFTVLSHASIAMACQGYKLDFQRLGLLTNSGILIRRLIPFLLALLLVEGVAFTKISIALARGRHNIGFLVFLALVVLIALIVGFCKRRTGLGDRVLREHQNRFENLKSRAMQIKPGGATNEAALLAALWGVSVLPAVNFPYIKTIFPKAAASSSDGWSSGCGGGGCGGGSSGGCGGGGCGGGCGGCGG